MLLLKKGTCLLTIQVVSYINHMYLTTVTSNLRFISHCVLEAYFLVGAFYRAN